MPITVTTLDDFDRADSSTLGSNWLPTSTSAAVRIAISGNAATVPAGSTYLREFWIPDQFGPDVEVQLDLSTNLSGGRLIDLFARLVPVEPGVPPDEWAGTWNIEWGYRANFQSANATLSVADEDGEHFLDDYGLDVILDPAGGGAVALRCEGDTITALIRFDATSDWETVASATDTTWPAAGYVGFGMISGATPFATGTQVGDETPAPPTTLAAWGILAR